MVSSMYFEIPQPSNGHHLVKTIESKHSNNVRKQKKISFGYCSFMKTSKIGNDVMSYLRSKLEFMQISWSAK